MRRERECILHNHTVKKKILLFKFNSKFILGNKKTRQINLQNLNGCYCPDPFRGCINSTKGEKMYIDLC